MRVGQTHLLVQPSGGDLSRLTDFAGPVGAPFLLMLMCL